MSIHVAPWKSRHFDVWKARAQAILLNDRWTRPLGQVSGRSDYFPWRFTSPLTRGKRSERKAELPTGSSCVGSVKRTVRQVYFHYDYSATIKLHCIIPVQTLETVFLLRLMKRFIMQLTFADDQVADLLEELGAYLEGHLAQVDAVSRSHLCKWNSKW